MPKARRSARQSLLVPLRQALLIDMVRTLLVLTFALSACSLGASHNESSTAPVPKGLRLLGMDTNDAAADYTFNQSFASAQSIGVGAGTLHIAWSSDEGPGSGATSGAFTDSSGAFAAA